MRSFLLILTLLLGACSSETISDVVRLSETYALASAEADAARVDSARASAEYEAARAFGARDAADLEELAREAADAEAAAAQAEAQELRAKGELEAAKAAAANEIGAAAGGVAGLVPGMRPLVPLAAALALWGAAAYGQARAAKRVAMGKGKEKGKLRAVDPPPG